MTTGTRTIAKKAGITAIPTTLTEYTNDLKQIKAKGVLANPLDIPFAAAEGLSTYWYQLTAAFGGEVLNANYAPQISSPNSAGYKALAWMVNAYKTGLVAKANINDTDYGAMTSEMAEGRVASVFSDYSGNVGSLYDVPSMSKVVGQVEYIPVPGVSGRNAGPVQPRWHRYPEDSEERCRRIGLYQLVHQSEEPGDLGRAGRTW